MFIGAKRLALSGLVVFGVAGWLWGGAQYIYAKDHAHLLGKEFSFVVMHNINVANALKENDEARARELLDDRIDVYATVLERNAQRLDYEGTERYNAILQRVESYRQHSIQATNGNGLAMVESDQ